MAEKMLMLALSPTMEEGSIVSWNKKEGDTVSSGDIVCEVETDKATMDYESMQDGVLLKILVEEGQTARVEQPIAVVGAQGEDISTLLADIEAASETTETETGVVVKEPPAPAAEDTTEAGFSMTSARRGRRSGTGWFDSLSTVGSGTTAGPGSPSASS